MTLEKIVTVTGFKDTRVEHFCNLKKRDIMDCFLTYIRGFKFTVPAVASIMSHFVGHVLSKSHFQWIHTNLQHKLVNATKEVGHCCVLNYSLFQKNKDLYIRNKHVDSVVNKRNVFFTQAQVWVKIKN